MSIQIRYGPYSATALEIVDATLTRNLRRTVSEPTNAAETLLTPGIPGLLSGQLVTLHESWALALAWDVVCQQYPLTLTDATEVWRNLATVPKPEAPWWSCGFGNGGAGTSSVVTSDARFWSGSSFWMTWSTLPSSNANLYITPTSNGGLVPLTANVPVWCAVQYATNWATGFDPYFVFDVAGTWSDRLVVVLGDGTQVLNMRFTPAVSGTGWLGLTNATAPTTLATLGCGSFAVIPSPTRPPFHYLAGDATPLAGLVPSWTGTANRSASVVQKLGPLTNLKFATIGQTTMRAEKALPGKPSRWLHTAQIVERS